MGNAAPHMLHCKYHPDAETGILQYPLEAKGAISVTSCVSFYAPCILAVVRLFGMRDFFIERKNFMETRVAIVAIIVENLDSAAELNGILSGYAEHIIGRMGLPYRQKGINIISVVVDAPHDTISALSGKIGRLDGVSAKTVYSK